MGGEGELVSDTGLLKVSMVMEQSGHTSLWRAECLYWPVSSGMCSLHANSLQIPWLFALSNVTQLVLTHTLAVLWLQIFPP